MSLSKHTKQQEFGHGTMNSAGLAASQKSNRKAPGTRAGTIQDWRAAGKKAKSERGPRLRDGR
jgi:hypothetical protein